VGEIQLSVCCASVYYVSTDEAASLLAFFAYRPCWSEADQMGEVGWWDFFFLFLFQLPY
jgi:hypothetical protein